MKREALKRIAILGLVGGVAGALLYVYRSDRPRGLLERAMQGVAAFGLWGEALFVVIYVVTTVLLIPGSALGLGAGAVFGLVRGSLLVSLGSTLGATCAFLLGRYLARDWISKKIQAHPRFAAIDQAVAAEGWKIVLLTRLSPVFPFTLLNYAFGLTKVSLGHYVLASWGGMLPGTILYVYLGSLVRTGLGDQPRTPVQWMLYGLGLVATVAVALMAARIASRALAKSTSGRG